jgi:hypothetical protein
MHLFWNAQSEYAGVGRVFQSTSLSIDALDATLKSLRDSPGPSLIEDREPGSGGALRIPQL